MGLSVYGSGPYINISEWNAEGEAGAIARASMTTILLHEMGRVCNSLIAEGSGGSKILQSYRDNPNIDNDQTILKACFPRDDVLLFWLV